MEAVRKLNIAAPGDGRPPRAGKLVSLQSLAHVIGVKRKRGQFDFDVAIIGGGSGGYAAARTAAGAGLKIVVIEGGEEVGGLCILRGCMPTKALLYAAEVKHLAERAETWGVRAGKVSFDFAKVMARKNAQIKDFADFRVQQLTNKRFKFIRADAKFVDANTVKLGRADLPAGQDAQQRIPTMIPAKHFF